jgi:coenzyme PQQ synthesis protein D (PqqD)
MTDEAAPQLPEKVEIPVEVVWQRVEDQVVLLELADGQYFALDKIGSQMWELLQDCDDVRALPAQLEQTYETDQATLRRDLAALIDTLVDADLLRVTA